MPVRAGQTPPGGLHRREAFHGRFRQACLNARRFTSLTHAMVATEVWRRGGARGASEVITGRMTPAAYLRRRAAK